METIRLLVINTQLYVQDVSDIRKLIPNVLFIEVEYKINKKAPLFSVLRLIAVAKKFNCKIIYHNSKDVIEASYLDIYTTLYKLQLLKQTNDGNFKLFKTSNQEKRQENKQS